jgi:hypothetical protein
LTFVSQSIPRVLRSQKAPICRHFSCRRRDSNPRHADYDSVVLWLYSVVCGGWGTQRRREPRSAGAVGLPRGSLGRRERPGIPARTDRPSRSLGCRSWPTRGDGAGSSHFATSNRRWRDGSHRADPRGAGQGQGARASRRVGWARRGARTESVEAAEIIPRGDAAAACPRDRVAGCGPPVARVSGARR